MSAERLTIVEIDHLMFEIEQDAAYISNVVWSNTKELACAENIAELAQRVRVALAQLEVSDQQWNGTAVPEPGPAVKDGGAEG